MLEPSRQTTQVAPAAFLLHVQGLRALAVLTVLVHHIDAAYLPGGFIGVDIFFVISGYLITSHIVKQRAERTFSLSGFYFRRIRRIIPNQIAVILAVLVAGYLVLDPGAFELTAASAAYSAAMAANVFFLQNSGYFAPAAEAMPLLHMWSLAVEEQFYLIWPATIMALGLVGRGWRVWLIGIAALGFLIATEWAVRAAPTAAFYMTPFRILEFMCGAALVFWRPAFRPVAAVAASLVALAIIAICLFAYDARTLFPGALALIPCAATAILIAAGDNAATGPWLGNRLATAIGDRSYALYLVHWPVIVLFKAAYPTMGVGLRVAIMVGLTVALTELLYQAWEKPLRYWKMSTLRARAAYGTGVVAALGSIVLAAGLVGRAHMLATGSDQPTPTLANCANGENVSIAECEADILIVGDSHAHVVYNALQASSDERIALSGFLGCPPVFGAYKVYTGRWDEWKTPVCRDLISQWERELPRAKAQTIILAARWAWLTEPGSYGGENLRRDPLVRGPGDETSPEHARRVARSQLDYTVGRLIEADKDVILIGQVPVRTDAEVACAKTRAGQSDANARCRIVQAPEALSRVAFMNRTITELAAKYPDLQTVIPADELCEDECDLVRGSVALYRDSNHLSEEGAALIFADVARP